MKLGVFYCATSKISEPNYATEHQPKSTPNDIRQRHLYAQSKRFWIIYYVISVVSTPHFPNIRPKSTPISFPRTLTFTFLPRVIPVPNIWAVTESSLSPTPVSTPSPTFPSKPCAFTSARLTEALTPAPTSVFQAPAFASKKSASSSPFPEWRMDAFASALFCFSTPPSSITLALA